MDLDLQNLLLTAAEIAVAFVGFASLVGVFLSRNSGHLPTTVRILLRALLDYGLLALLGCGIPLILALTDLEQPTIWMASSGCFLVVWVGYVVVSHFYYQEIFEGAAQSTSPLSWSLLSGDLISILLLAGNAIGWPFVSSALVYFLAAIAWRTAGAALSFRAVLREAWSEPSE